MSQADSGWAERLGIKCHHPDGTENCGCPHYSDPKANPICRYAVDRQADIEAQRKALLGLADTIDRNSVRIIGAVDYFLTSEQQVSIVAVLRQAAKERPEPTTAAWLPIGDAPETIQEFAKHCEIADDRKSYIEFGGTIEDGRPFVLCLAGAFSKVYDRWFILPNVDVVAAKEPQR